MKIHTNDIYEVMQKRMSFLRSEGYPLQNKADKVELIESLLREYVIIKLIELKADNSRMLKGLDGELNELLILLDDNIETNKEKVFEHFTFFLIGVTSNVHEWGVEWEYNAKGTEIPVLKIGRDKKWDKLTKANNNTPLQTTLDILYLFQNGEVLQKNNENNLEVKEKILKK